MRAQASTAFQLQAFHALHATGAVLLMGVHDGLHAGGDAQVRCPRSARNAATATSFAAFMAQGSVPPRSPAARASARQRNVSLVRRGELERAQLA